jgi:hypothetical protein
MQDPISPIGLRQVLVIAGLIISGTSVSATELFDNVLFRRDNTSYEDAVVRLYHWPSQSLQTLIFQR